MDAQTCKPEDILDIYRNDYLEDLPQVFYNFESLIHDIQQKRDPALSAKLFRDIHSLKGTAGTFNFTIISEICHQLEEAMELQTSDAMQLLLKYVELMRDSLAELKNSITPDFGAIELKLYNLRKRLTKNKRLGIIVDPSRLHTSMVKKILEPYPVQLTVMNDGLAALSRMLYVKYDFVIASRELPSLNGIALISAIKNSNCMNSNIFSIILSGEANFRIDSLNSQPDQIVIKDSNFDTSLPETLKSIFATS